jgi:endonuclease YncB( thermonuclease family)
MTRPLPPRFDYALTVASVVDGDTIRGRVTRVEEHDGTDEFVEFVTRRNRDPRGIPIRLMWVNTPEYRDDRPAALRARDDTAIWLASNVGRLRVETCGRDDLSRHLGDIYVDGDRGNTLSQYLIRDRGWPPYLGS